MKSLGYYKGPSGENGELLSEKDIQQSIMEMQRFAGIPASGILDEATTKLIETPRCGMRDINRKLDDVKRKRRYTLQGSRWQKSVSNLDIGPKKSI